MKRNKQLIIILIVFINAQLFATPIYREGELYLATDVDLSNWVLRSSIVVTGEQWFDTISNDYGIYDLREVTPWCIVTIEPFYYRLLFDDANTVEDVIDDFEIEVEVEQAWPVYIIHTLATPNDDYYSNQWALEIINAEDAWDYVSDDDDVLLAIIDSGVDLEDDTGGGYGGIHRDLYDNLFDELYVTGIASSANDDLGHGTHVAGIAGAVTNNDDGIAGIAGGGLNPGDDGVSLLIIKAISDSGNTEEEYIANGLCFALDPNQNFNYDDAVDIVNMSLGRPMSSTPLMIEDVIELLLSEDVLIVSSAGNDSTEYPYAGFNYYPAAIPGVIGVSATNENDVLSSYSNWGDHVDISAPGGTGGGAPNSNDIFSTTPWIDFYYEDFGVTEQYGYMAGTSMATPYVSGLAALIMQRFPNISADEVTNILYNSSEKIGLEDYDENGWNQYYGYGRINAFYAIAPPVRPQNFIVTGNVGEHPTSSWNANTEPDIAGYYLYKNEGGNGWQLFQTLDKNTTSYTDYSITIGSNGKINACYQVSAFDITDQESVKSAPRCKPIGSTKKHTIEILPESYLLDHAFPNPFNPVTQIKFGLPEKSHIQLVVYDLLGREIVTLKSGAADPGWHTIQWGGYNNHGRKVPSGIYIYTLTAESFESEKNFVETKKMVLLK